MEYEVPKFHEMMLPLLQQFADGQEYVWDDFTEIVAKELGVTEEQVAIGYENNLSRSVFKDRMSWAKTFLSKAKLIEKTEARKTFKITKRGRELLATEPPAITVKLLKTYPDFWDELTKRKIPTDEIDEAETPEEEITSAISKLSDRVKEELLDSLQSMHPQKFEFLVVELLVRMGYGAGEVTRYTSDGGIDGIIRADAFGFEKIYIQAKRWQNAVGRRDVTQFVGDIMAKHAKKGIFITTSSFNKDALNAANVPEPHVILVDGPQLCDYLLKHELGVVARESLKIYELDKDFFEE